MSYIASNGYVRIKVDNRLRKKNLVGDSVRLAFVGSVVDAADSSKYPAYSISGDLFQKRLLRSLSEAGLPVNHIFSVRPIPSFPQCRRLWFASEKTTIGEGLATTQLPFLNLGILKRLTLGIALFFRLLLWGLKGRRNSKKVILLYNIATPPAFVTLIVARIIRAKVFAIVADLPIPGSGIISNTFLRRLDFQLQTRILPLFHGLIVLTRQMAYDFAPQVPFIHMEGAVPQQLLQSLANPSEVKQSGDQRHILMYAGKLDELSGIPLLLEAFPRLQGDQYRLWIVGKGPLQQRVERAAKEDSRIIYWGFLPYAKVLSLYGEATVLINPRSTKLLSTRYLFPSKLIEYIATGRPVITTCTSDVEEEYGPLVFILRDETPEGLSRLVVKVTSMSSIERDAVTQRARAYIMERKTWEHQGERIAEFIRRQLCTDS